MLDDNPFSFQLQKFHYSAVAFVVLLYVWNLDKEVPKINTQKSSIEQFLNNQRVCIIRFEYISSTHASLSRGTVQ